MSGPSKTVGRLSDLDSAEVLAARAAARARFAQFVDDEGETSVAFDADNPSMTDADLARLRPAASVVPILVAASLRRHGIVEGGKAGTVMPHMDVIASDGTKVGTVDHMDGGDTIKLAKSTSPDGEHHDVPMVWVAYVDQQVYLEKSTAEITAEWHAFPK